MTDSPKPEATKHTVKRGVAYVEVNGVLTRNYVTLGGKRQYVVASEGAELTAAQAKKQSDDSKSSK